MENKYLVSIEFRYYDVYEDELKYKTKTITIGVYDDFSEACINGNNVLEFMESKFKLHEFPDGQKAKKDRLTIKNKLITNLAYLKTPFTFYLKITELKYYEINEVIEDVLKSCDRYQNYKNAEID